MPLSLPTLSSGLEDVCANPGDTAAACAQAWADAVQEYAAGITPPSTTVAAAAATLASALAGAFADPNTPAAPAMESAFAAFAVTVGTGMLPAFVATPPPAPVGFALQLAGPKPETHAAAGQQIGALIDAWARTGTATPSIGGAPVPWT